MQFTKLFDDDRAVSPVIGVILMVAITVILAAVIGTFVLGLTDSVQGTASAGVDVSDEATTNNVTIVSMGENTVKVACVDSSGSLTGENGTSVGAKFDCADGNSIIAIGDDSAKNSTIKNL